MRRREVDLLRGTGTVEVTRSKTMAGSMVQSSKAAADKIRRLTLALVVLTTALVAATIALIVATVR